MSDATTPQWTCARPVQTATPRLAAAPPLAATPRLAAVPRLAAAPPLSGPDSNGSGSAAAWIWRGGVRNLFFLAGRQDPDFRLMASDFLSRSFKTQLNVI